VTQNRHPLRRQKARKCQVCKEPATQWSGIYAWCKPECGAILARKAQAKQREAAEKAVRKEHQLRKQSLKPRSKLLAETQRVFNAYIRERDKGLPCVSCGRPNDGLHQRHAGHYRPVGSNPALRFEPDNCHAQCSVCNNHLSGNLLAYRATLIARIGLDRVEWLEGPHVPAKWSSDDLEAIKAHYRNLLKTMTKESGE
jgi:5-methylcytosine-specific restriction endonuclease McrA